MRSETLESHSERISGVNPLSVLFQKAVIIFFPKRILSMETKHIKRGHTDEQISQWVDREGKIDLDRLTEADIAKAAEVVSVNRWLKNNQSG